MITPELLARHLIATSATATVCLWISVCLILKVWILHRDATLVKKILWSVALLIPVFGWIAHGGVFQMPGIDDTPVRREHHSIRGAP